jgi:hypothetical protein
MGTGRYRFLGALALSIGLSVDAHAAPIVDQQFHGSTSTYGLIGGEIERAQTFTVGVAGQLTAFDASLSMNLFFGNVEDLMWGIFATTNGVPDEVPLASGILEVALSSLARPVTVDVSSAFIQVMPGDVLAFGLTNTSARLADESWFIYGERVTTGGGYLRGAAFLRVTDGSSPGFETWNPTPDVDWRFTTFVDPVVVPEPNTALLFATGVLLLRASNRRQARQLDRRDAG